MRFLVFLFAYVHACGRYCGAWMCAGAPAVGSCDYSVAPQGVGDDDCVDRCCMVHDQCCDGDVRDACNAAMRKCLSACDPGAGACLYGVLPLPAWAYEVVFGVVEGWCCDRPCAL